MGEGPLEGIRVLDLTRLLPGGYCTLLLADLGADVVKVEEPGKGDYVRWSIPTVDGESAAHRALNRGKRSITLNLKMREGVDLLLRLAERFDVLVESYRPGVLDRLGVGYEAVSARNPAIVFCAITGYGQDGPYRDLAGHDVNYIGYAGVLGITGARDGTPVLPGVQVGDLGGGGLLGAAGILAALVDRARTGRGRFVDAAMLDGAFSWLSMHLGNFLADGEIPGPARMPLNGAQACYRVYRAGDGRYLSVGALEPQFWEGLVEALGRPDLADEQFAPRQEEIAAELQAIFETKPRDEWVEELAPLSVCVGPVNDLSEAVRDPQLVARGMVAHVNGAPVGPSSPLRLSGSGGPALTPAPGLGEHTAEVLAEVDVDDERIASLRAGGAV